MSAFSLNLCSPERVVLKTRRCSVHPPADEALGSMRNASGGPVTEREDMDKLVLSCAS